MMSRIRQEAVIIVPEALLHLREGTEQNHEEPVRTDGIPAELPTGRQGTVRAKNFVFNNDIK